MFNFIHNRRMSKAQKRIRALEVRLAGHEATLGAISKQIQLSNRMSIHQQDEISRHSKAIGEINMHLTHARSDLLVLANNTKGKS